MKSSGTGKRLVSGFGLTVGSAALAGTLSVVLKQPAPDLDKSLLLRPFPQDSPDGITMAEFRRRYRQGMIQQAGISTFIAGLKVGVGGKHLTADGVLEEYRLAKESERAIIPVGYTGHAAKQIWDEMKADKSWPSGMTAKDRALLNNPTCTLSAVGRLAATSQLFVFVVPSVTVTYPGAAER